MSRVMNVVTIFAVLFALPSAEECTSRSKMEDDVTSLLQVDNVVKTGKGRTEKRTDAQVSKTDDSAAINHESTEKIITLHDKKAAQNLTIDKDDANAPDLPAAGELVEGASKDAAKVPVKDVNNNPDSPPSEEDLAEEIMKAKEEAKVGSDILQEEDNSAPVDDNSTSGVSSALANEIEFQAGEQKEYIIPTVNKWGIMLMEVFAVPAIFGVDRCCMGQCCMGVVKGCTFGGLGVWYIIDLFLLYSNAGASSTSIGIMGLDANWEAGTEGPAFWIAAVGFCAFFGASIFEKVIKMICACCCPKQ